MPGKFRIALLISSVIALAFAASAIAKPPVVKPQSEAAALRGSLVQLPGTRGCLVDRQKPAAGCGTARALEGPGPFMGSRAIAVSPDGRNVYAAASKSDAVAIFRRNPKTGALIQPSGTAGCVADKGADGCAQAIGLDAPNSIAISPNGRNVYVTSRALNTLTVFKRDPKSGALSQLSALAAGCISKLPNIPGCDVARGILDPDVVVVSPDGLNVYVGAFIGNSVATFTRNSKTGALSQPAGTAACIAEGGAEGCEPGVALGSIEGLAVSRTGTNVYAAAAISNALAVLSRDPETGALTQASGGCIVNSALSGCVTGTELAGANAVATSPGSEVVYATSLLSNSVTAFAPIPSRLGLAQKEGTAGCSVWLRSAGCGFVRSLQGPEGLVVSPDGSNLYAVAFITGAIIVFDRSAETGNIAQKAGKPGCLAGRSAPHCTPTRALKGVSSIAVSPDGRNVYSTSFGSNAVNVFRRIK